MNRRHFLRAVSVSTAAIAALGEPVVSASGALNWPVGCFNRPWSKWGVDAALDGTKEAGFKVFGLLTRTKTDPFISTDATPEYLEALKKKIAARGLIANMGAIRTLTSAPLEDAIKDLRVQIDHAQALGLEWLLSFGVDRPADQANYFKIMADGSAYAAERKIKMALKPHGGSSGASEDILHSIKEINHPNLSIWFDAGNIIYYTGKDPVTELEPVAKYVSGFCMKDCAQPKGDVMIQLGTGKVDFKGVFATLKKAGFNGPIMLEGSSPGQTAAEATANARANREFIEKTLAAVA